MDPDHLKSLPLFSELSEDDLRRVATFASEDSVHQGRAIMREGDYGNELVVIEEGTAEVTRDGEKIAELGPGDVFGEIALLEKDTRRNATVTAKTSMRTVTLSHWDVRRLPKATIDSLRALIEQRRGPSSS